MKTRRLAPSGSSVIWLTALLLSVGLGYGSEPAKDHRLFVGSDFSVKLKGKVYPVIGAGDRTFVVQTGQKPQELPLSKLPDLQISRGLKLTRLAADITNIDARLSSDAVLADQFEAAQTSMSVTTMSEMRRDAAIGKMFQAELGRSAYNAESKVSGVAIGIANAEQNMRDAFQDFVRIENKITSDSSFQHDLILSTGSAQTNTGEEVELTPEIGPNTAHLVVAGSVPLAPTFTPGKTSIKSVARVVDNGNGQSDRFDLNFELSSPQVMDNAYIVVVTEYAVPQKPGEVFRRVLTERVGRIEPTPHRVRMYQNNFPPGFTLRNFLVSLYAEGQEVATNLSDTKMLMSRDEAHQYVFADHLATHKGETLPPAAVLMTTRAQLRHLTDPALRNPVYVSVDASGQVVEITTDAKRKTPPAPAVLAALQHFDFLPALEKGAPASGRARLVVADFLR